MALMSPGSYVSQVMSPGLAGLLPSDTSAFAAMSLFPHVRVALPRGSFYALNNAEMQRIANDGTFTVRAHVPRDDWSVTSATYETRYIGSSVPYDVEQQALAAGAFSPADLARQAALINTFRKIEKHIFAANFTTSLWFGGSDGTTPTTKWDVDGSDPIGDVVTQLVEPVLDKFDATFQPGVDMGLYLFVGKRVWSALSHHDQFRDFAGFLAEGPRPSATKRVAAAMGLTDIVVSGAVENTAAQGATASLSNVVGDGALLLKLSPGPFQLASPSAAALLVHEPISSTTYTDPGREQRVTEAKTWCRLAVHRINTDLGRFLPNVHSGI